MTGILDSHLGMDGMISVSRLKDSHVMRCAVALVHREEVPAARPDQLTLQRSLGLAEKATSSTHSHTPHSHTQVCTWPAMAKFNISRFGYIIDIWLAIQH